MLQSLAPLSIAVMSPSRVKAVVAVDNQVLLLRRPCGEWDLPGGRVDMGESLEVTLQRELIEEIGLMPDRLSFMQFALRARKAKPPVQVAFYGCHLDRTHLASGLRLSAEHQEAQLMPVAALAQLTMPPLYVQMAALWLHTHPILK